MKKLFHKELHVQMFSLLNTVKHLNKKLYQYYTYSSRKLKRIEHFLTNSIRTALLWYQKPEKNTVKKKITNQHLSWT